MPKRRPAGLGPVLALLTIPLLAAGTAFAQVEDVGPVFAARSAEGRTIRGELRALGESCSIRMAGGMSTDIPGEDLLWLEQVGASLPPFPSGSHIILTTGDRIPTRKPRLIGERLFIQHPYLSAGRDTQIPFGMVSVIWWRAPDQVADVEKLRRGLVNELRKTDVALLANGDSLRGTLLRLDGDQLVMDVERRSVTIEVDRLAALALSSELAEKPRAVGRYARVVLAGASGEESLRLALTGVRCQDGRSLEGKTLFGVEVKVPLGRLLAMRSEQGRGDYLPDLKATRYQFYPYLDLQWPLVHNGSVSGGDLQVGRSTHEKGLGMHSRSQAVYTLDGKYRRFEATVGLDPRRGRLGSARVRVWLDGKSADLPDQGLLDDPDRPLEVSLDIRGVKEMMLEVDRGTRGNVQGRVSWAEPVLVK